MQLITRMVENPFLIYSRNTSLANISKRSIFNRAKCPEYIYSNELKNVERVTKTNFVNNILSRMKKIAVNKFPLLKLYENNIDDNIERMSCRQLMSALIVSEQNNLSSENEKIVRLVDAILDKFESSK